MKKLILALAAVSMLATAIPAKAGTCTTTCNGYGNSRTCYTNCY
ncbi:hypothetical protein [Bradyrhizobium liaoningense]|nr:hypothetical protein [Bradyrhizobium liaoningense]